MSSRVIDLLARGESRSTFVLGCAPLGGLYQAVEASKASETLQTAWDHGVRIFDTAPHYGVGLSEQRLGQFLANYPRDEFVISTKVGRLLEATDDDVDGVEGFYGTPQKKRVLDYSAKGTRRSIEESCERLQLNHIDIALVHDPDDYLEIAAQETIPALLELRDEGVVGAVGVGMNYAQKIQYFLERTSLDCVLMAGQYSLLKSDATPDFFALCREKSVSVLVGGVFNSGVLANPVAGSTFDYRPASQNTLSRVQRIAQLCQEFGTTLPAAAIHFVLANPDVNAVVIGASDAQHVIDDLKYLDAEVPSELFEELHRLNLLGNSSPADPS